MKFSEFTCDTLRRDAFAGIVTGLMAIPLTIGICLMSEYPIQTGLLTVIFACIVGFIFFMFKPGNFIGVPGVAAGLAPVLAMSIHKFGFENMPFLIFLTAVFQGIIWKYNLQKYILKAVPHFLIEGLLAGIGLKIALKFLHYTFETNGASETWLTTERIQILIISTATMLLFLYLFSKYKVKSPAIPYVTVIGVSVWLSLNIHVPMLHTNPATLRISWPFPDFNIMPPIILVEICFYAIMLSLIDVIEQVMSNAAIEKIDPFGRKCDTNNSLLSIWVANLGSSFFGGMTNLDGLAKSATNGMAGAQTKLSNLFVAAVLLIVVLFPELLSFLPEYALAVLMIFTGWKMISGLLHAAAHGKYALILALFCGILVFKLGIFEGLLISMAVHGFITYVVYRHEKIPTLEIIKKFLKKFTFQLHPHNSETLSVDHDPITGGLRYSSIQKNPAEKKSLMDFINDWSASVNSHNILNVVSTYDYQGLLWGTFAKELRTGHPNIKKYFEHLFELNMLKVHFESSEIRQYKDIYIQSGSYNFSYHKKDEWVNIPARYSFVCKKEKTGWYILEHHSSQFPE